MPPKRNTEDAKLDKLTDIVDRLTNIVTKKVKIEKESERVRIGFGENSVERDHQATPSSLYDPLNQEFLFDFDPCPLHEIDSLSGKKIDGLKMDWG
jgi:hypothetical protein